MNSFVRYIDKTREYYASQGYEKPYEWAHFDATPFAALSKPLSESRAVLVSTSEISIRGGTHGEGDVHMGLLGGVYSLPSNTPVDNLFSPSHSYDQFATSLEDVNAFYPAAALNEAASTGRIGSVTRDFVGVYNAYSQRLTSERDAPEVLRRCSESEADVAILVPV